VFESDRNPFKIDTGKTARKYVSVKANSHELTKQQTKITLN